MPAVFELFDIMKPNTGLVNDHFLKNMVKGCATAVKSQQRYKDIWDLGILLDHIRNGPDSNTLPWTGLSTRTAALFMVFIPLRAASMLHLNPSRERRNTVNRSVEVLGHDKTDTKKGAM
jgi:hypothetical protein